MATKANVPTLPGSGILHNVEDALETANRIGYPVLIKAVNGGGGMSIEICSNNGDIIDKFERLKLLSAKLFGNEKLMIEKYLPKCRHIEIQVFGDGKGNAAIFGERECSVQRRWQKVIEECPAPNLPEQTRQQLFEASRRLCSLSHYESCGTVEFAVNADNPAEFYFLEMNTRIQVEHEVTELTHGELDLVELMIRQCTVEKPDIENLESKYASNGHTIQVRMYAENPTKDFRPCPGVVQELLLPVQHQGFRLSTGVERGSQISLFYDPMLAKILQWGTTRDNAIEFLLDSLMNAKFHGPPNNLEYIIAFLKTSAFASGQLHTKVLDHFEFLPRSFEVITPGFFTTVQCYPGREVRGLWRVGVPPSAAMDPLACKLANRLVGNNLGWAVLECTIKGPTLKFFQEAVVAVTGARVKFLIDGNPAPMWKNVAVPQGGRVTIGEMTGNSGCRAYIAVKGGIDVPIYLGSKSTFINGSFGGYQGRKLECDDLIKIGAGASVDVSENVNGLMKTPEFTNGWIIGVLPGPYANPDYFTDNDIQMLYDTQWKVHHDSNRLGIRLVGPSPSWVRTDGGEGGSHPSNVHDYVYAIGSVNFTGDMPIIIGTDGPSLGGFVCPCTIIESELWKVGQLRPADTVQFRLMTIDAALNARVIQLEYIKTLGNIQEPLYMPPSCSMETRAVLHQVSPTPNHPGMQIRLSGDRYILVEYGSMVLDLNLRFRIHFLEQKLLECTTCGLEETAPGVRSLQVRFNALVLPLKQLINLVCDIDSGLPDIASSHVVIPTRVIHLPMCFNYSGVDCAIKRYMKLVREEAPYLPSNIEFIKKNNGLDSCHDVEKKVFSASYMCLGLGDVYLGAPCAVPISPLDRVVVPKYNPARTFTQEGTVGLGGTYMCIYPMNSPGGYQLVGRSLPIWNTYGNGSHLFSENKPWLLKMFDQIRFYKVSEEQLDQMRGKFVTGKLHVEVEEEDFDIHKYNKYLEEMQEDIANYKKQQKAASQVMNIEEQLSLARMKEKVSESEKSRQQHGRHLGGCADILGDDEVGIYADVPGMVCQVMIQQGSVVAAGHALFILEAMKMQNTVLSTLAGMVLRVYVNIGDIVSNGDLLAIVVKI